MLTQKDLANKSGVGIGAIIRIEKDQIPLTAYSTMVKLLNALGKELTVQEIVHGIDPQ